MKQIHHYRGIVKMSDINERIAVVETKIEGLENKVEELKEEVKHNHESLHSQLQTMAHNSTAQHAQLHSKIANLEKTNYGWMMWLLGASAVISAAIGLYNLIK